MGKHVPLRMCVACRRMRPPDELLRFVRDAETGEIKTDTEKKLFGRGAYICRSRDCIRLAAKKRGLERQFKCAVPAQIYSAAEDLI